MSLYSNRLKLAKVDITVVLCYNYYVHRKFLKGGLTMKEVLRKYDERIHGLAERLFSAMPSIVAKAIILIVSFFLFGFLFCTERGGYVSMYFGYAILLAWLLYTFVKLWRFGVRVSAKNDEREERRYRSSGGRHAQKARPYVEDWDDEEE